MSIFTAEAKTHTRHVTIICAECETVQPAQVESAEGFPFASYFKECEGCGYLITESEWNEVDAAAQGGGVA